MKAFKITNNSKCKDQLYEVGQTYQIKGKLIICQNGFHFCKNPDDLFNYYKYRKNTTKIFEIEVLGECIDEKDKSVTDRLKVIREIPLSEYNDLFKNHQFDENYNLIYCKYSDGFEYWKEYDNNGNLIHHKSSNGLEYWKNYDNNGKINYHKSSNGYEYWCEYDNNGNQISFKNSFGYDCRYEYDNNGNIINAHHNNTYTYNTKINFK